MDPLDLSTIDPGVRCLVSLLRAHGHETTRSGDGRSKLEEERTLGDMPHVHVRPQARQPVLADVASAAHEARRIAALLRAHGVHVMPGTVQLTWDPCCQIALISVLGVSDADLPAGPGGRD